MGCERLSHLVPRIRQRPGRRVAEVGVLHAGPGGFQQITRGFPVAQRPEGLGHRLQPAMHPIAVRLRPCVREKLQDRAGAADGHAEIVRGARIRPALKPAHLPTNHPECAHERRVRGGGPCGVGFHGWRLDQPPIRLSAAGCMSHSSRAEPAAGSPSNDSAHTAPFLNSRPMVRWPVRHRAAHSPMSGM